MGTMSKHKTKFQKQWLNLEDCNKHIISSWAKHVEGDEYSCYCIICITKFSSVKGVCHLNQHAKSEKHVKNLFKLNKDQLVITNTVQSSSNQTAKLSQTERSIFNQRDAATRIELYWIMETVNSNNSTNSCYCKKELFQVMFPRCVPDSLSLSPSKASYLITEALGPFFKNELLSELQKPNTYFTIQYDETSNVKHKKELQIRVNYWSCVQNIIVNQHLVTYFIEKGDGNTLFSYLLKALDSHNLSLNRVLALGSDGPNVNKKVMRLFQEQLKKIGHKRLVDIGSCFLHIVNNAFLKGLNCLRLDANDFIIKVFFFFEKSDLRCANYEQIQGDLRLPKHKFIKHISTRWLTLGPACERLLEQLPGLQEYFLKYIPKHDVSTINKQNYVDIMKYLKDPALKPTLAFICYASKLFTTNFTLLMQKEQPLVHILYTQLQKLVFILITNIVKPTSTGIPSSLLDVNVDDLLKNPNINCNIKDVICGKEAKKATESLTEKNQLFFFDEIKNFYVKSIKHIVNKIKDVKGLEYFQCLSPENIKKSNSADFIVKIAQTLPFTDIDIDVLAIEWRLLQVDQQVRFVLHQGERIDSYWHQIFSLKNADITRYPIIKRVVQGALSLVHGSADVERGFSKSGKLLTDDKSHMSEQTLNAKLSIVEGLKRKYDSKPWLVPITEELMKLARGAYASYMSNKEKQKKIEEEKEKQKALDLNRKAKNDKILENIKAEVKSIKSMEVELEAAREEYNEAVKVSETMQNVLKDTTNNNVNTKVIQEVVRSLDSLRQQEKEKRDKFDRITDAVQKRKSKICETAANKKMKL